MFFSRLALVRAVVLSVSTSFAFASPVGTISGTVKDPTGAVTPGVTLKLLNTSTNAQVSTATNENGEFTFLQLAPATYSLEAEHAGFKKTTVSSVLVQVDQVTHLELQMELGNVADSVQVEAAAPLLENDRSTLSSVVDTRTITSMPLNARQ